MSDLSLLPGPPLSDTVGTLESEDVSSALRAPVDWGSEFQTQARSIRRWLTRRVGSAMDAEDVVQDTFLQAHRGGHHFRGDSRPSTWLYGIALNLSRRWLAAQGISRRLCEPETCEEIGLSPEPAELLASRQALAALDRAMAELPATQAEVLWLVAVEELSRDEIALRLAITPAAVRSRLSRARAQLRAGMGSA
ncbi:RNA polymerase sigma factor [Hydrogenophaga sp.]|uniref:RNA polymerase sigma factor n=1 Tax=Hydrogenophaga sp. TaxID=1904254 RepID=UPI002FC6B05E